VVAAVAKLRNWTPAQIGALVFGMWWIGNGIAVFFAAEPSVTAFNADGAVRVLGISLAVNGWHGVFHLATGLAGVAVCRWPRGAWTYALLVGMLYLTAALSSLFTGATVFSLIHVDELGSADHAIEGVVLLVAWLASPGEVRQASPRRS
jgi:Domain of unknown function (DUF4383)